MSETPVNITNFPPDAQAFIDVQAAKLARKDADIKMLKRRYTERRYTGQP